MIDFAIAVISRLARPNWIGRITFRPRPFSPLAYYTRLEEYHQLGWIDDLAELNNWLWTRYGNDPRFEPVDGIVPRELPGPGFDTFGRPIKPLIE
jgi:hypothetical protein